MIDPSQSNAERAVHKIKVHELAYVRMQVPDLDAAERFFGVFGLHTRERTANALYLRAHGPEHRVLVAHLGERRLRAIAYELASADELAEASLIEGASPVTDLDEPGGGRCVRIRDCDGNLIELVHGIERSEPIALSMPEFNFAHAKDRRRNETVRPHRHPSRVQRLGHVVLRTPDVTRMAHWYQDHLGLLESDDVEHPSGDGLLMSFVRLDHGDSHVDHHVMQILHGDPCNVHHISFEVAGIDDLYVGSDVLREAGYRQAWGIGRHVQGSQIFDYWLDPFGVMYEHWTDSDMLDASAKKGLMRMADMHSPWGPPMPPEFVNQGTL